MKKTTCTILLLLFAPSIALGQTVTSLVSPSPSGSASPPSGLVIAPDAANLAEKYAADREAKARAEHRQKVARWTKMAKGIADQLDNAEQRLDVIDGNLDIVRAQNPRIVQLESELVGRIDRAERQARDWADIERTVTSLPQTFIDVLTGRGIRIGVSTDEKTSTPPPGTTDPVSGETKGAVAATAITVGGGLLAWYLNRRSKTAAAAFDERNLTVTQTATQTAMANFFAALRSGRPDVRIGGDHPPKQPPPVANGIPFADKEPGTMDSGEFNTALIDLLSQRVGRPGVNGN